MISQCNKIFNVEYTASGTAIMTGDLLGLDTRSSVIDSANQFRVSAVNCDLQDLIGLDFGMQSVNRQSIVCRPKPAERQHANRAGIVEDVHWQRDAVVLRQDSEVDCTSVPKPTERQHANRVGIVEDIRYQREAVLLQENSEVDSPLLNGTVTDIARDENPVVIGRPVAEDKNAVVAVRPVPARRAAVRSSSFESHLSPLTTAPGLPVPPPKRNRQRVASNVATLQSQVDRLTTQLKSTAEERDAALAKVTELEAELNKYHEMYGHID